MLVFLTHPDGHQALVAAKTVQGACALVSRIDNDTKWNQSVSRIPSEQAIDNVFWIKRYDAPEQVKPAKSRKTKAKASELVIPENSEESKEVA